MSAGKNLTSNERKVINEIRKDPEISNFEACKRAGLKHASTECSRIFNRPRVIEELAKDVRILEECGVTMRAIGEAIARGLKAERIYITLSGQKVVNQDYYAQLKACEIAGKFLQKFGYMKNEKDEDVTNNLLIVLNNKSGLNEVL